MLNLPAGFEKFDEASKRQAIDAALMTAVERLEKITEGQTLAIVSLRERVDELEASRQRQITLNGSLQDQINKLVAPKQTPRLEANRGNSGLVANLLEWWKQRKK